MADDDHNPYAPPADAAVALGDERGARDDGPNDFESERRPWLLCLVLTFVTLGFYPSIWLLRRGPFLDRQDTGIKLGTLLPIMTLVLSVVSIIVMFGGQEAAGISRLCSIAGGITALIANFRVLNILRSVSSRTGRFLGFSTMGTFFLGIYYLQYKINEMADTPARAEGPRRKKKKRKKLEARDAAEADAEAELRAEEEARKLAANDPPPAP